MAVMDKKRKLISLIHFRAWSPVLKATAKDYSASDQKKLKRVQEKTLTQKERYNNYKSAEEVRQRFHEDLRSKAAKRTNADLESLGLPTQPDIADTVFELADKLGVRPARIIGKSHKAHPPHPWHKSKPKARKKAARALKKQAAEGRVEAIRMLEEAPVRWAREVAKQITKKKSKAAAGFRKTGDSR